MMLTLLLKHLLKKHPLMKLLRQLKVKKLEMKVKQLRVRKKFPHGVTPLTPWVHGSTSTKSVSSAVNEASLTLDPTVVFPLLKKVWMKNSRRPLRLVMKKPSKKLLKKLLTDGDVVAGEC